MFLKFHRGGELQKVRLAPYRKSGLKPAEEVSVRASLIPLDEQDKIVPVVNEARRPANPLTINGRGMRSDKDFESGAFGRRLGVFGEADTRWLTGGGKPKIGNRGGGGPIAGGIVMGSGYTLVKIEAKEPKKTVMCLGCGVPYWAGSKCLGCKSKAKFEKTGTVYLVKQGEGLTKEKRLRTKEEDELYRLQQQMRATKRSAEETPNDRMVREGRESRLKQLTAIVARQTAITGAKPRVAKTA